MSRASSSNSLRKWATNMSRGPYEPLTSFEKHALMFERSLSPSSQTLQSSLSRVCWDAIFETVCTTFSMCDARNRRSASASLSGTGSVTPTHDGTNVDTRTLAISDTTLNPICRFTSEPRLFIAHAPARSASHGRSRGCRSRLHELPHGQVGDNTRVPVPAMAARNTSDMLAV